ncbi:MAG: Gfo/Idh/MocA family oxidoreductase [Clostridiales bacterium]|nr:Gfo/Idh/MocA family oxidoreductase [Clostridiales bacterium]
MDKRDGLNYAPKGNAKPVVKPGEFVFAACAMDHGHINGMVNGLTEAGATLKYVYDPDPKKVEAMLKRFPGAIAARSEDEILQDKEVQLVASAAIPALRCDLGLRVMDAGKDYFTDKSPLTTLEQLERAKAKVKETGKKYAVYYSERLHVESAVYAGNLIADGAIGKVLQVIGMGPHRLNPPTRPDWIWKKDLYGGILNDIGSHQIEQFLFYTGATDATVESAHIANYNHPEYPEFEDFGDASLKGNNGTSNYFRVDWFTPDGLGTWGDGRLFILGTDGYIEQRKYINVAEDPRGNNLFVVDHGRERYIDCNNTVGFPYFGQLILDCLNRTENAMTQEHAFKAVELCCKCQDAAVRLTLDK